MSCNPGEKITDNLTIYGEVRIDTQELLIWLIVPNTDKNGTWIWKDQAVVLFTDSHDIDQGVYHYSLPLNSLDFERTKTARVQDFGDYYDNGGINFDATIVLDSNPRITINALNAGIGWDGGVNLRIKNLTLNICQAYQRLYYFSTKIQDFFNGKCYRIGGDSYSGSHGLGGISSYYKDTRGKCDKTPQF